MQKETTEVEVEKEDISRIWELVCENPGKHQAHLMISKETGLPAHVVRAVIRGKYRKEDGRVIVTVPANADHTVEIGGRVVAGRMKLIGTVIRSPQYVIGRGCSVKIDVNGESFEVLVTKGHKPWTIAVGTKIGAVGMLKGGTLWADDWWRLSPPAKPEATRLQ